MTLQGECFVVLKNVINLWERDFLELGTEREGWVEREGERQKCDLATNNSRLDWIYDRQEN